MPSLATVIRALCRSIPRHEGLGVIMGVLTFIVEKLFPNPSPLKENSARALTFHASKYIYGRTRDVVSGSLACAILVSFLISRDETPIYVFLFWAICVVSCMCYYNLFP